MKTHTPSELHARDRYDATDQIKVDPVFIEFTWKGFIVNCILLVVFLGLIAIFGSCSCNTLDSQDNIDKTDIAIAVGFYIALLAFVLTFNFGAHTKNRKYHENNS